MIPGSFSNGYHSVLDIALVTADQKAEITSNIFCWHPNRRAKMPACHVNEMLSVGVKDFFAYFSLRRIQEVEHHASA